MHLWMLINSAAFRHAMVDGYIKSQGHPSEPLTIYNYTPKAQYEEHWTPEVLICRGLVLDNDLNVVARPFDKFHNLDVASLAEADVEIIAATGTTFLERDRAKSMLSAWTQAYDKIDGSLGIIFYYAGRWHVATRGSFTSDQALWATEKLKAYKYALGNKDLTYLVEIVYPENRIVCDYGSKEDLVLLGARETDTGAFIPPRDLPWFGERSEILHQGPLEFVLELPPREGAEGLVLHVEGHGMWKLKQEDYVALHRLMFGLNARRLWEIAVCCDLRNQGYSAKQVCEGCGIDPADVERIWDQYPDKYYSDKLESELPEEFRDWLYKTDSAISHEYWQIEDRATRLFLDATLSTPDRKSFALAVNGSRYAHICYAMADQKPYKHIIWKEIKPEAIPMRAIEC